MERNIPLRLDAAKLLRRVPQYSKSDFKKLCELANIGRDRRDSFKDSLRATFIRWEDYRYARRVYPLGNVLNDELTHFINMCESLISIMRTMSVGAVMLTDMDRPNRHLPEVAVPFPSGFAFETFFVAIHDWQQGAYSALKKSLKNSKKGPDEFETATRSRVALRLAQIFFETTPSGYPNVYFRDNVRSFVTTACKLYPDFSTPETAMKWIEKSRFEPTNIEGKIMNAYLKSYKYKTKVLSQLISVLKDGPPNLPNGEPDYKTACENIFKSRKAEAYQLGRMVRGLPDLSEFSMPTYRLVKELMVNEDSHK